MIDLEERFDTVEEMQAFLKGIVPATIFDDVSVLQEQMAGVLETLGNLNTAFVPENCISINNADLNDQIGKVIIAYGNHCTNKPSGLNGYLVNIPHDTKPNLYGKQLWFTRPANNVYIRSLEDGVWGAWKPLHYDTGWKELPLEDGVLPHNATDFPCRIRRIANVVYVQGVVTGFAEITKVVAILPSGYRPEYSFYTQNVTNAGCTDTYRIYTDGRIERIATTRSPQAAGDYHFLNMSFIVD